MAEGGQSQPPEVATEHRVERFARATKLQLPNLMESLPMYQLAIEVLKHESPFDWKPFLEGYCTIPEVQERHLSELNEQLQKHPSMALQVECAYCFVDFLTTEVILHLSSRGWSDVMSETLALLKECETPMDDVEATMVGHVEAARMESGMEGMTHMIGTCLSIVRETRAELSTQIYNYAQARVEQELSSLSL